MNITDILNNIRNDNGTYSEKDIEDVERLTGKPREELFRIAEEKSTSNIAEGKPSQWNQDVKLSFISEHGFNEYKRLINERK